MITKYYGVFCAYYGAFIVCSEYRARDVSVIGVDLGPSGAPLECPHCHERAFMFVPTLLTQPRGTGRCLIIPTDTSPNFLPAVLYELHRLWTDEDRQFYMYALITLRVTMDSTERSRSTSVSAHWEAAVVLFICSIKTRR